ncbi:hypothetical protein GH714_025196 [Hevea brasiliensis]|uniref:Uncharacterized protein n=1 Tax=Hevea brasiliensis TaxID=3981 RepID=A0A6A6LWC3_HEVBR|nr:hypothetical protein GH714_025196 [Hevea brasiliensis]
MIVEPLKGDTTESCKCPNEPHGKALGDEEEEDSTASSDDCGGLRLLAVRKALLPLSSRRVMWLGGASFVIGGKDGRGMIEEPLEGDTIESCKRLDEPRGEALGDKEEKDSATSSYGAGGLRLLVVRKASLPLSSIRLMWYLMQPNQ